MGHELGGLYYLDFAPISPPRALQSSLSLFQWHCGLGHPSLSTLKHQVHSLDPIYPFSCEACQFSKHHSVSFPSKLVCRVSNPFELVHSNVRGPFSVASNKFQYFATFVHYTLV